MFKLLRKNRPLWVTIFAGIGGIALGMVAATLIIVGTNEEMIFSHAGIWALVITAVICVLCVLMLVNLLTNRHSAEKGNISIAAGENWSVDASEEVLTAQTKAAIHPVEGTTIKSVKLNGEKDVIDVFIDMAVTTGINIPKAAGSIQSDVQNLLDGLVGKKRSNIRLFVSEIANSGAPFMAEEKKADADEDPIAENKTEPAEAEEAAAEEKTEATAEEAPEAAAEETNN